MKVFAISDLHLSGVKEKPMNIFGEVWEGHFEKISADWRAKVTDEDIVLIGGDTSWGMKLEEGMFDVARLAGLPGRKVFIRGNHDYWWSAITRVRTLAPDDTFFFLQNDCVKFENVIIAGSRGWTCPGSADYTEHDEKLYLREAERFRLAFCEVGKVREEGDTLIALIHYPPMGIRKEETLFTRLFDEIKSYSDTCTARDFSRFGASAEISNTISRPVIRSISDWYKFCEKFFQTLYIFKPV